MDFFTQKNLRKEEVVNHTNRESGETSEEREEGRAEKVENQDRGRTRANSFSDVELTESLRKRSQQTKAEKYSRLDIEEKMGNCTDVGTEGGWTRNNMDGRYGRSHGSDTLSKNGNPAEW